MSVGYTDDRAHNYAAYRPSYPDTIYKTIFSFYEDGRGETCGYDLAVDVACGSGQSSRPLCKMFCHVTGCDINEQFINTARKHVDNTDNLSFEVCRAEKLEFLDNNSTDLVTVATALHMLDRDVFFQEVRRVLKPGGAFAAYCYQPYGKDSLDEDKANSEMVKFYSGLLGDYLAEMRSLVETKYSTIELPFTEQKRIESDELSSNSEMTVDAYIGYVSTWSMWREYKKYHPDTQHVQLLRTKLHGIYGDRNIKVKRPGFILLARK